MSSSWRQTGQRILIVMCVTAVIIAGVLYAMARWRVMCDPHYGDAASTIEARPAPQFADDPSLKFVAVMFRHGDRAPVFKYKTDPLANAFPEETGELTKKGKQHMYKKGQILRRLYNGFLSELYLDSEIITKTTNVRRTYMSAAMVLAGLYPPKDYQKWSDLDTIWQPIPIYHDSPDDANLFSRQKIHSTFTSIVEETFKQIYNNTDNNITASIFSYLSEKCGEPITIKNVHHLYDIFKCQVAEGLQLPEWVKPNYLQIINTIFENDNYLKQFYGNTLLQKCLEGRLLQDIVLEMESRASYCENQSTSRKMHIYSGHDFTTGMTLGFLGTITRNLGLGFSVHFHLHFDVKIGYIVKVFYFNRWDDEQGKEVTIPTCGDHCKLQDFIQLVRRSFVGDWKDDC